MNPSSPFFATPWPTLRDRAPGARFLVLAGFSLLGGVLLGALLRGVLAGFVLPFSSFPLLRHAHSHLGYYGVLFPLVWWTQARVAGTPRPPGPATTAVYALAVLAATIGFATQGYGIVAIVSSTVVLAVWLGSAWRALPWLARPRSWWWSVAPSITCAAIAIPAVAVLTSRDPALARELVQGFLTMLLFGVVAPTALDRQGAPAAFGPLWWAGVAGASLLLGPWPTLVSQLGTALLGLLLIRAGWQARAPLDLRALWMLPGAGMLVLGSGLLVETPPLAIAGLHFVLLGPVLLSLAPTQPPALARAAWLLALGLLTLGVMGPAFWPAPGWSTLAAGAGVVVALLAVAALAWAALCPRRESTGTDALRPPQRSAPHATP